MTSSFVLGARMAAARLSWIGVLAAALLAGCGGGGGDDDDASGGGGPTGSTEVRIPATSYSDLLGKVRQRYPGVVPESVYSELATYTAGEANFSANPPTQLTTSWGGVKRFDAGGIVRVANFNVLNLPVSQVFGASTLMGFWKVDLMSPSDVANGIGRIRTYGSPNQLVAPDLAANFGWAYQPGYVPGVSRSIGAVAVTEGLVYDQAGVLQGRTLNIFTGVVTRISSRDGDSFDRERFISGRYRSYVLQNRVNPGLVGLAIDHDASGLDCGVLGDTC